MNRIAIPLVTIAVLTGPVSASTVNYGCEPDGAGGVVLSYTVTANEGETIKDFHLLVRSGKKLKGSPRNVTEPESTRPPMGMLWTPLSRYWPTMTGSSGLMPMPVSTMKSFAWGEMAGSDSSVPGVPRSSGGGASGFAP